MDTELSKYDRDGQAECATYIQGSTRPSQPLDPPLGYGQQVLANNGMNSGPLVTNPAGGLSGCFHVNYPMTTAPQIRPHVNLDIKNKASGYTLDAEVKYLHLI